MDIVERLRKKNGVQFWGGEGPVQYGFDKHPLIGEAADTIQQQAERIRDLEADLSRAINQRNMWDRANSEARQQLSEVVEYATKLRSALPEAHQVIDRLWVSHHANRADSALKAIRECRELPLPKAMQG